MQKIFLEILVCGIFIIFSSMRLFAGASVNLDNFANQLIDDYQNTAHFFRAKKIAVLNFDALGPNAKKNQIGQVIAELLIQRFSDYPGLKVIEREKLDLILKELNLNLSGAVTPDSIKRTGLILGVDYLLLGSVTELKNQFLIQARIVNVETAEVITAKSMSVNKDSLIEKSQELNYLRQLSGISLMSGRINFDDLSFKKNGMGAELYYVLPNRNVLSFEIFKSLGDNTDIFRDEQVNAINPPNNSFVMRIRETINSAYLLSLKYKLGHRISSKTRFYTLIGPTLYILNTKQYFCSATSPNATFGGLNLPIITDQTYTALGINTGIGFQRYINPYLRFGMSYSLHYFSFHRELDPRNGNESLIPQIEHLNKRVSVFGNTLTAQLTFSF